MFVNQKDIESEVDFTIFKIILPFVLSHIFPVRNRTGSASPCRFTIVKRGVQDKDVPTSPQGSDIICLAFVKSLLFCLTNFVRVAPNIINPGSIMQQGC